MLSRYGFATRGSHKATVVGQQGIKFPTDKENSFSALPWAYRVHSENFFLLHVTIIVASISEALNLV